MHSNLIATSSPVEILVPAKGREGNEYYGNKKGRNERGVM